ncbi:hypothetical protein DRE_02114 [Drechslerella stenobrocha 248]|uniref:HMG box domain-containing protein n=1 Tax=Drechslerella stenobrocha 248 TaxID=1043628 RepID=W7IGL9_9PEZI|nr:hypothetical protein DRE_02114 [Drechslerella stenobrocha 248]
MLAVGRSRFATGNGLSLPKLGAIVARAIARSGPLSSFNGPAHQAHAAIVPFVKANLPLITSIALREYATATKKKTTATKKKPAVRKPAARKPAARKPAAKKPAARKPAAKKPAAKRTTAAKKPAARRAVATKAGTRRTATKKKPLKKKPLKKKKVIKKKKVEKKPGVMTFYRQALRDEPPKAASGYNLFYSDHFKKTKTPTNTVADIARSAGAKWQEMPIADKQGWIDNAKVETARRKAAYQEWLNTMSPLDIQAANRARLRIHQNRLEKDKKAKRLLKPIQDSRFVPRALNAYTLFVKDTILKPEVMALEQTARMKKCGELWRAASDADKKKYKELASRDKVRFDNEKLEFAKKYATN